MSVPNIPSRSVATGPAYAASVVTFNDPGASPYTTASPNRIDGKFFLAPIQSEMLLVQQIQYMGGGAIQVYNNTGVQLNIGTPVYITGYQTDDSNTGNPVFLIAAADASIAPADALLLTNIANNTQGVAYAGGDFTPTATLNTSASAVGANVYLAAGGGLTLTAPSGVGQVVQVVGRVKTVGATGIVAGFIRPQQVPNNSSQPGNAESVPSGQTLTIASGFGYVVPRNFTINGSLVINGDLMIL